ncbi:MAG: hypothetical protein HWE34_00740 [Methylocystaceae bacterium]|nr:hypothetical protein [Methylocystaceae bacterium]
MQMSVSPQEIAEHLVQELGHKQAFETFKHHASRCREDETRTIWDKIGSEINRLSMLKTG